MGTPAGRSGCEPTTRSPRRTLGREKRFELVRGGKYHQLINVLSLRQGDIALVHHAGVMRQDRKDLLTQYMLLQHSADHLQTDALQLLGDLKEHKGSRQ